MVGKAQVGHLARGEPRASGKETAIPSSALELRHLNTSVRPEAKCCLLAGLVAPQAFAGLRGSSSPARRSSSPGSWWGKPRCLRLCLTPATAELCLEVGAAAEQPRSFASAHQPSPARSPAPQPVSLFICA